MIAPGLKDRISKIRLVILDVDGVLTDGRIVYDNKGNELKFFDVQDGFGIILLNKVGIESAIITAKKSRVVARRAQDFKVKHLYMGHTDKLKALQDIVTKSGFKPDEICYMGDDLVDIPVLKRVGFAVSVPNAVEEAKEHAHFVTKKEGGRGAVREVTDLIIKTQGKWDQVISHYTR